MGFRPLFDPMLNGSLYGRWPHTGVWACLMSRVSRAGTIDEHPTALAAAIGCPIEVLKSCIADFMSPDPESRTISKDGRRLELIDPNRSWGWRVINHSIYKEKARKKEYGDARTASGADAERKRAERAEGPADPKTPDVSRDVPLSSPSPSPSPTPEPEEERAGARRLATRIPEGFSLTEDRRAVATAERVDPDRTFAKFCDHWRSASGQNARKVDWDATWRNWCRREADTRKPQQNGSASITDRLTWRPTE